FVGPMGPDGAALVQKALLLHHRQETDFLENPRGRTEQRLTHMRARMDRLIQDQMVEAGLGKISAQSRSGRTRVDDDDLGVERAATGPRSADLYAVGFVGRMSGRGRRDA